MMPLSDARIAEIVAEVKADMAAADQRRLSAAAEGGCCSCCDKPLPPPYEGSRMCAECAE